MASIEDVKMTSVRVEEDAVDRVREYVRETRQTIGGFISMIINEKMNKLEKRKSNKK